MHVMTALYRTLWLLSVVIALGAAVQKRGLRSKRGLLELAGAIKCSTGRSPFSYVFYGCYCGLGGEGMPKDKADKCCFEHDCCYGDAETQGCSTKTGRYHWTCEDQTAECDDLDDNCEQMMCECDKEAAKCLRKAPYNRKYAVWPDFMCGKSSPECKKKKS